MLVRHASSYSGPPDDSESIASGLYCHTDNLILYRLNCLKSFIRLTVGLNYTVSSISGPVLDWKQK